MVVLLPKRERSISGLWTHPNEWENTVRPRWLSGSSLRVMDLKGLLWPQSGDQWSGSRTHYPEEAVEMWWEHNLIIQSSHNCFYRLFCTAISYVPNTIASHVSVPAPKWESEAKKLFISMWPPLKGAFKKLPYAFPESKCALHICDLLRNINTWKMCPEFIRMFGSAW